MNSIVCALLAFLSIMFRFVGGLRKLGIDIAKSTVEKYQVRSGKHRASARLCRWGWIVLNRNRCSYQLLER